MQSEASPAADHDIARDPNPDATTLTGERPQCENPAHTPGEDQMTVDTAPTAIAGQGGSDAKAEDADDASELSKGEDLRVGETSTS